MSGYPVDYNHANMQAKAVETVSTASSSEDESVSLSSATSPTASTPGAHRERTFACPEPGCNGRFHRKFTLREHIKTHTGEKPYQCAVASCGKLFSTSGNLSRHRRLHMLTRIKCPILDCTRVFTKQEKLLRHLKVHMGSAAHACNYDGCTKTFSTSGNLCRHQRTQHRGGNRTDSHGHRSATGAIQGYSSGSNMPSSRGAPGFNIPSLQPSMVSLLSVPMNAAYSEASQSPAMNGGYAQSLHYQRSPSAYHSQLASRPSQQNQHHHGGVSETDIMVLLDCLFTSDGRRMDPTYAANASSYKTSSLDLL